MQYIIERELNYRRLQKISHKHFTYEYSSKQIFFLLQWLPSSVRADWEDIIAESTLTVGHWSFSVQNVAIAVSFSVLPDKTAN